MLRPRALLLTLAIALPFGFAALGRAAAAQPARPVNAPTIDPSADSLCPYTACGLGIAPTMVSLDVVRGAAAERVARLGFLWPGDVRSAFAGNEEAVGLAARAVRTRHAGAILTDLGLAALAIAVAIVVRDGGFERDGSLFAAGGAALVAASLPVHFRADAQLSRAVWVYNGRFARPPEGP